MLILGNRLTSPPPFLTITRQVNEDEEKQTTSAMKNNNCNDFTNKKKTEFTKQHNFELQQYMNSSSWSYDACEIIVLYIHYILMEDSNSTTTKPFMSASQESNMHGINILYKVESIIIKKERI